MQIKEHISNIGHSTFKNQCNKIKKKSGTFCFGPSWLVQEGGWCAPGSVFTGTGLNHLKQVFIAWLILYFPSVALHFSTALALQP